jgi:competence protein ComEC
LAEVHPLLSPAATPWFGAAATSIARYVRILVDRLAAAWAHERDLRRPFLWLPVAAGAGAIVNLTADRDPSLVAAVCALLMFAALAWLTRTRAAVFALYLGLAAFAAGHASMNWRISRVAAPVLSRLTITNLTGFVEEIDHRRAGARLVLRLTAAEGLAAETMPRRVRLTTRQNPGVEAGDHIALKARLLPPARAALPGGYDFARDAYFAGIGGVGNALGKIERRETDAAAPLSLRVYAAIDRFRNALVARIASRLDGDTGAIAAAMVTGKRDLLSPSAKELIREAGIFHIITISGIQMTLVAGIFFIGLRQLFALSRTLALDYPIKKWAAACAIAGAIAYDIMTGSRVGTERALVMTLVLLGAVIVDRPSLSMRNLAIAAIFILLVEPEALLGASFQLSFAAVAALVAVYESRMAARAEARAPKPAMTSAVPRQWLPDNMRPTEWRGVLALLFATFCATAATASFMAYNFHELSPYVLIGNPLTLAMIEFFAVPSALLGTLLYPFGLDAPVWAWLGLGIDLVIHIARWIAAAPGATLHLQSFGPASIVFLSLGVLSIVIWRTAILRATAIPFFAVGLAFAANGPRFDVAIAATGEGAAVRGADGQLVLLGARSASFAAEQWLRADGDGRLAPEVAKAPCDTIGCAARLDDGRAIALVTDAHAFPEDCERAFAIVTPLFAPSGCNAALVFDRRSLAASGAVTLDFSGAAMVQRQARSVDEDRPWSRRPPRPRFERQPTLGPDDEESARATEANALSERLE